MKKQILMLLLLSSLCFSAIGNNVSAQITNASTNAPIDLIKDWRVISILLILISIILVSIAYMAGQAFEMPELKAWASVEISQVIATALIIAFLFIGIAFIDGLMIVLVQESDISSIECLPTDDCALKITTAYFNGLEEQMDGEIESLLKNAVVAGEKMGRRSGISGTTLIWPVPTLWASFSMAWAPQNILHLERYNTVIEFYTPLFSSMYAQQFFVTDIVPKAAPYLLFLGIIARSFFVTRRLGGLLIAIAVGVMIVFPLMYVFDWITLDITIYGDKALQEDPVAVCPEECQTMPPAAYNKVTKQSLSNLNELVADMESTFKQEYLDFESSKGYSENQDCTDEYLEEAPLPWAEFYLSYYYLYSPDSFISSNMLEQEKTKISNYYGVNPVQQYGTICTLEFTQEKSTPVNSNYIYCLDSSLTYPSSSLPYDLGDVITENTFCPISCRELPYPFGNSECNSLEVQWACSQLPDECKVRRTIPDSKIAQLSDPYKQKIAKCEDQCKMIPPMNGNCMTGTGSLTGKQTAILPEDKLIKTEDQCREIRYDIFYMDDKQLTEDQKLAKSASTMVCKGDYGEDSGAFVFADFEGCAQSVSSGDCVECIFNCFFLEDECLALSPECRVRMENKEGDGIMDIDEEAMTDDCDEAAVEKCPASLIPEESCVYVVPNYEIWEQCADCLLIDEGFTYAPPIAKDCAQLCSDTNWKKDRISPAQFAVKTREGMVGRSEIKNAASFVVPLYILPLLNILVTIMFIKTLSQILGGDIEIPGLQKVF